MIQMAATILEEEDMTYGQCVGGCSVTKACYHLRYTSDSELVCCSCLHPILLSEKDFCSTCKHLEEAQGPKSVINIPTPTFRLREEEESSVIPTPAVSGKKRRMRKPARYEETLSNILHLMRHHGTEAMKELLRYERSAGRSSEFLRVLTNEILRT